MKKRAYFAITSLLVFLLYGSSCNALTWVDDNSEVMEPGDTITISVVGDCPPYTWKVDGGGFSVRSVVTQDETNTLSSDDRVCGSTAITVADSCGETVTGFARGGNGFWEILVDEMCGELVRPPDGISCCATCGKCSDVIVGKYRYIDCWKGGSRWGDRYRGPYCSKWPYTEDLTGQTCRDPGYYPSWTMQALFDHKMYEWKCPDILLNLPANIDNNGCPDEQ